MRKNTSLTKAIAIVKEHGYAVEKKVRYIKHSFEVEEELLSRFDEAVKQTGLKKKQAINEAIRDWVQKISS